MNERNAPSRGLAGLFGRGRGRASDGNADDGSAMLKGRHIIEPGNFPCRNWTGYST
jgi:hypothetical protein